MKVIYFFGFFPLYSRFPSWVFTLCVSQEQKSTKQISHGGDKDKTSAGLILRKT